MSQANAPREFKFVGGPSRKRRRRNAGKPVPVGSASVQPVAPALRDENEQEKVPAATPSLTGAAEPMERVPNGHTDNGADSERVNGPGLLSTSVAGAAPGSDFLDWLNASSMNPFFEPGLSFISPLDQNGGQTPYQVPFYFGPDIPFVHLWDSPPTDSSPHDDAAVPPVAPAAEIDESGRCTPAAAEYGETDAADDEDAAQPSLSLPHAPGNISDTISRLLTRYDQEFCVMPLTHDFEANPFRFNTETGRGSQLLLHCILALSYKHIHRDTGECFNEAKSHKKRALQMLREMDNDSQQSDPQNSSLKANFLDAVLILMTLDCATSAHGPWVWYLKRALKMIQATESLHVKKTPRMQARIEMLVWWDVTLALTSRRGCVLSEATALSLFSPSGPDDASFYMVSGCPDDLFKYMIRLGAYAREFELAANMTCVKFDMGPVLEAERNIREWSNPEHYHKYMQRIPGATPGAEPDPGDLAQYREDLHHCAEAWRYGLLIYIERVFKWVRDEQPPSMLGFLARKTLNHVASCRRATMLQKQLLLPVFLAGCETNDEYLRQQAREYCTWWNEKTRYDMFLTATALLEEVWAAKDPKSWWGSIIDNKTRFSAGGRVDKQYLFG